MDIVDAGAGTIVMPVHTDPDDDGAFYGMQQVDDLLESSDAPNATDSDGDEVTIAD